MQERASRMPKPPVKVYAVQEAIDKGDAELESQLLGELQKWANTDITAEWIPEVENTVHNLETVKSKVKSPSGRYVLDKTLASYKIEQILKKRLKAIKKEESNRATNPNAEVAKASKAKTAKKKAGEDIAKVEEAMKAEKAKRELKTKEDIEMRLAEIREEYEADKEGRDIQTQADAMVELYGGYANAPKDVKAKIDAQVAKLSARRQELVAEERELEKKLATLAKKQTPTTLDTRTEGQKEDGGYSENSANSGAIGLARMRLEGERLSLNGTDPDKGGVRFSVEDSGDKKVEDGVRFRFSETEEEFRATQKEAVEKKGIVMPNLADAVVEIVDDPSHNFKGTLKEAREEAKKWAQDHYVGKEFFTPDNGGTYVISKNAIDKYLDKTSIENSDNASVHLSALTKIPEIISNSITGEIHADYKKDVKGERSVENGIGNSGLLVHRLYGAMNFDNKIYRVKTTMHEFISSKMPNLPHSYEVTKIELIEDSSVTSLNEVDKPLNRSVNSINGTKLLQGVEKSYDKGKYLLGGSVKNVRSSDVDADYSGEGGVRFRFIGEQGAKSMDKKEGTTARMDNLAVAKKILDEYSYKEVEMATGWEQGMDGKWRYETPDFEQFDVNGNLKFEQRHPDYARYRELVKKSKKSIDKYNIKMHRRVQKGSPMLCL